jgi:photosystem II stability/assembly factor-like uncharacterized protein
MAELEKLYAEAKQELSKKNFDRASVLLKQILAQDENYKDASRLLAQIIQRRRRRWYNQPIMWGILGVVGLITLGVLITPLNNNSSSHQISTPPDKPSNTPRPATTLIPTTTPTPASTPIPLVWKRLWMGQELPRNTISAIAIDPGDAQVIYIGTVNAGIYKSIDGGISWQPVHNGLESASVSRLVFDPQNSRTLYASTIGRLYRTTDGGTSWQELEVDDYFIDGNTLIAVDPHDSQTLYYANQSYVYQSTDGGAKWQTVKSVEECPAQIYTTGSFVGHPSKSGVLYASEWDTPSCQKGIYRSSDGGRTWIFIGPEGKRISQIAVGVDPKGNDVIYASDNTALYISQDGGATWATILYQVTACHNSLLVDPDQPATVYCGVSKSENYGVSWNELSTSPPHELTAMAILNEGSTIIAGTRSGLFVSVDSATSWTERSNGLANAPIELDFDPSDGSIFYANLVDSMFGLEGNKLFQFTDEGHRWNLVEVGQRLSIDRSGGIYRVGGTGLVFSMDQGRTWHNAPFPLGVDNITSLATNPAKPGMVFVVYSDQRLFFTINYGASWEESTLPQVDNYYYDAKFFFDHDQGRVGYLVPFWNSYRTLDAGKTWQPCGQVNWSPPSSSKMVVDPRYSRRILLATLGEGLLLSEDNCQTWNVSNNGLGSMFVNSLTIDLNNPDMVYAGTDAGAYVSFNGGQTWDEINTGLLGATVVYSIGVNSESIVYAATPYGIFVLEGK